MSAPSPLVVHDDAIRANTAYFASLTSNRRSGPWTSSG